MDVFDVLTLPATAAPRLRGGAAWTGCGSPEGIFHDTPHPAALRTWIRPVQAAARRKPSYRPQLFLALFFFPSSKLLLIFPPSTEFKGAWGSPSPTKAELLGRAVGSQVPQWLTPAPQHHPSSTSPSSSPGKDAAHPLGCGHQRGRYPGTSPVLQAGMWMGYSQLLCCSGEKMLLGSCR